MGDEREWVPVEVLWDLDQREESAAAAPGWAGATPYEPDPRPYLAPRAAREYDDDFDHDDRDEWIGAKRKKASGAHLSKRKRKRLRE